MLQAFEWVFLGSTLREAWNVALCIAVDAVVATSRVRIEREFWWAGALAALPWIKPRYQRH